MRKLLMLILIFLISCNSLLEEIKTDKIRKNADKTIEHYETETTIGLYCRPECPSEAEILISLEAILCQFNKKEEIHFTLNDWHNWNILFINNKDLRYYGMVDYNVNFITINTSYRCENYPFHNPKLCPGVFHWEMGNILMERLMAQKYNRYWVPERDKLQYRRENDLLYGCAPWEIEENANN